MARDWDAHEDQYLILKRIVQYSDLHSKSLLSQDGNSCLQYVHNRATEVQTRRISEQKKAKSYEGRRYLKEHCTRGVGGPDHISGHVALQRLV